MHTERSVNLDGFRHTYDAWLPERPRTRPVVALHGFGTTGYRTFRYVAPHLSAAGVPLYALDLLGFGRSERPEGLYSLERYAGLLQGFGETLPLDRPILLGHSLGGKVAAAAAATAPDAFGGLILTNPGGFSPWTPLLPALAGAGWVLWLFRQDWFFHHVLPRTPLGAVFPDEQSREQLFRLRHSHRALDLHHTGFHPRLRSLSLPTLVLWGEDDPILPPRTVRRIRQALPHAHVHLLPRAGHAPMKDQPHDFTQAVLTFALKYAPAD